MENELRMPNDMEVILLLAKANDLKKEFCKKKELQFETIHFVDILFSIQAYLKVCYNLDFEIANLEC